MLPVLQTDNKSGPESYKLVDTFNNLPAFLATGGEVVFVSNNFYEVHLKFNLNEQTRNYHGTGFGGAIYSSLDPVYPLQLHHILGNEYIIWDIAAKINYLKPIDQDAFARFLLSEEIIKQIITDIKQKNKSVVDLPVSYQNIDGSIIYAEAVKTVYIADREYFENKNKS